ncbi:MAG: hypothetical protein L0L17_11455, partial [Yaniella sp.]|nr:hypothetical protein [Yaniella sp.]
CTKFHGGPVGLSTLAIVVGEEVETVETVAEPYLVREGLLGRTPRGRIAMPAAWEHLGLTPPEDSTTKGLWSLMDDGASRQTDTASRLNEQPTDAVQGSVDDILSTDDGDD